PPSEPELVLKLPSPKYAAVTLCGLPATVSEDVVNVATPEPFTALVATSEPSIVNTTEPVGVPDPGATATTVALNVTLWPTTEGFAGEVTLVIVLAGFTVCVTGLELLEVKLLLPPYSAVNVCDPIDSDEIFNVATPEPFSVPVPSVAAPS